VWKASIFLSVFGSDLGPSPNNPAHVPSRFEETLCTDDMVAKEKAGQPKMAQKM
jgi:hypothetical protein